MLATVRHARREDFPAAAAVVRAVYEEFGFAWEPDGYHADLADIEAAFDAFWVAELDGRVVGCAGIASRALELPGSDCSLERLYVLREARGHGTGFALLEAALAGARERGRARMEIWSDKLLEDAHRLYVRFGARVVSERIGSDPDESAEWGLLLDL